MSIGALIALCIWLYLLVRSFRNPFYGILGYYWLTVMRPQDIWFFTFLGGLRLSYFMAGSTIVSIFFNRFRGPFEKKIVNVPQNKIYFLFWIGLTLSYLNSFDRDASWGNYLLLSKMVLFYYISVNWIRTLKEFRMMVLMVLASFTYLSYFANSKYFFEGFPLPIYGPGYGAYTDSNVFAVLFVIGIPFAYFTTQMVRSKFVKAGLFVVMITMIHSVILTFSRGGFLGMAVSSAQALLKTKKKWIALFIGTLGLLLFFQLWGGGSRERMETIFVSKEDRDASAQSRLDAWTAGLKIFRDRPLTGVGLDLFEYAAPYYSGNNVQAVAHNAYIQMLAEGGIFAGGGFILLLLVSLWDVRKLRKWGKSGRFHEDLLHYANILWSALLGYTVCSIFLSLDTFEPFYVLILLTVLLKKLAMRGAFSRSVERHPLPQEQK